MQVPYGAACTYDVQLRRNVHGHVGRLVGCRVYDDNAWSVTRAGSSERLQREGESGKHLNNSHTSPLLLPVLSGSIRMRLFVSSPSDSLCTCEVILLT
jgi:hypothetical protein